MADLKNLYQQFFFIVCHTFSILFLQMYDKLLKLPNKTSKTYMKAGH